MNCVSKKVMSICAIALLNLITLSAFAQPENLVENGSFEAIDGKVKKLASIANATGWSSPTGVTADLFLPGKVPEINTPENVYGKEDAKEGKNYAGIVAYSVQNKMPRSYLTTKLTTPLKKGMRYCVKFYVSLAEASKYASNQVGMNFSKKAFSTEDKSIIKDVAHILHATNDTKKLNQIYNWMEICGTYEALGGEKFLTIGNFSADDKTSSESNKKPKEMKLDQIIAAYYYVDDVKVFLITKKDKCDCLLEENKDDYSSTVYQKEVTLTDKMTPTQKVEKQQTFFAFGKAVLSPTGKQTLDFIAEQLKANAAFKLEVQGHSDPEEDKVGTTKGQYAGMAGKRTDAVIAYLVEKGIPENRLIASPQGSDVPSAELVESDDADLKMAKNRRVEFKIR
jgi:outer membrane protein OmpA-like peptidoglycan-associated protein